MKPPFLRKRCNLPCKKSWNVLTLLTSMLDSSRNLHLTQSISALLKWGAFKTQWHCTQTSIWMTNHPDQSSEKPRARIGWKFSTLAIECNNMPKCEYGMETLGLCVASEYHVNHVLLFYHRPLLFRSGSLLSTSVRRKRLSSTPEAWVG